MMHLLSQNLQQAPWGPCPCALSLHSVTSEPEGLIPTWYRLITSLLRLSVHKIYKAHPFCRLVCPSLPNWSHHAFLIFFFLGCRSSDRDPIQSRSSVSHTRPDQAHTAGTAQCKAGVWRASPLSLPVQLNLGVCSNYRFRFLPPNSSPLQFVNLAVTLLTHKPTWDFPTMEREYWA
jgi:hypothetical protein